MLKRFRGHRTKTAKALGIDRTTLWRKMNKYGLSL
jgi:transcriptional regulator of acetoin/glycerol metabolism